MTSPVDRARWLASDEGLHMLATAELIWHEVGGDALRAGERLRATGTVHPADAPALLEQVSLRQLARDRYGIDADHLLLTRDGLEAATRPAVADHRAAVLAASGARRVLDVSAGLGFDTAAFLRAGLDVIAVERDPVIATYLAHNCPTARVMIADVTEPSVLADLLGDLGPLDAVFVDPARRDPGGPRQATTGRARPERDPERWSPPWSWVAAIPHPRIAVKVAPSFTAPPHWQAQWVSWERTVVECALYSWRVTDDVRSAAVIDAAGVTTVAVDPQATRTCASALGAWLHEIDPAVMRAGAAASLARATGMTMLDTTSTWLTADRAVEHPALRPHRVIEVLPTSARQQRSRLRELGFDRATVKCRDVPLEPGPLLRELGLREGPQVVIAVTTLEGRRITALIEPVQRDS